MLPIAIRGYRRLDYWVIAGMIQPPGRPGAGRGSRRLFTFSGLLEIRVLVRLTQCGLRLAALRSSVKQFRKRIPDARALALRASIIFIQLLVTSFPSAIFFLGQRESSRLDPAAGSLSFCGGHDAAGVDGVASPNPRRARKSAPLGCWKTHRPNSGRMASIWSKMFD